MSAGVHPGVEVGPEFQRLRTLYDLLAALSHASSLEEIYEAALTSLLGATSADRAAIFLFDDDDVLRLKASRGLSAAHKASAAGRSRWKRGARDAQPISVPDPFSGNRRETYGDILQREGIAALAFIPLALDAGVFGEFDLYYSRPNLCTPDELEIAQAIASHVALATDRKRSEIARARTERRLQAILDNSSAVIFVKDGQGKFLLVNRRFLELFQLNEATVIGRTDHDLFPAVWADEFQRNDRAILEAGTPGLLEEHIAQQDGVHTYLSVKFPLEEPDGSIGICGISTDITDRKRLETAGQHLASIIENSNDAIIAKDLSGMITSWNKAAERMFGYSSDEVLGKPVSMLAAPERLDEMPEILSKIRRGLGVEHYETRRRRKDGRVIDVSLTVSPVRDSRGRVIGASKIARDITDRKLAEQERALLFAREKEARESAELLNRVGPRLAAQLDLEKLVQEVTDIATTLVGAEFGSFVHNGVDEKGESCMLHTLSGVSRDVFADFPIPRNTEVFAPIFRGERVVRSEDLTQDPRYGEDPPARDGTAGEVPFRSYLAAPVIARSGEVLGALFFGHSIPGRFTENHEAILLGIAAQASIAMDNARLFEQAQFAQTELKRTNEELRRANRDLEIFAYSASHDLKEPLRTIVISAQLIERNLGPLLHEESAAFLGNILTSSRRMSTLIADLLSYLGATKYEEGQAPVVDSAAVLGEVLETMRGAMADAGATVTATELPGVAIHATRLGQIFQNLIGNAIKYRNQEPPRIHITAEDSDGWCIFSVSDNGIGIESQYAERIFGLFKRLHGRDDYPGSGVGLAICQRIVEQYGGRIWLERSAPGAGSTFSFAIPSRTNSIAGGLK